MVSAEAKEKPGFQIKAVFFPGTGAGAESATQFRYILHDELDQVIVPSSITTKAGICATPLRRNHGLVDQLLSDSTPTNVLVGGHSIGSVSVLDFADVLIQDKRMQAGSHVHMFFMAPPGFGDRLLGIPRLIHRAQRMKKEKDKEIRALTDAGYGGLLYNGEALDDLLTQLLNGAHLTDSLHAHFLHTYHEDNLPNDHLVLKYLVALSFFLRAGLQWAVGMDTKLIHLMKVAEQKKIHTTASFIFFENDPLYTPEDMRRIQMHMQEAGIRDRVSFSVEQGLGHASIGYHEEKLRSLFRREVAQLY